MPIRLNKDWIPLTKANLDKVGGQTGVYQLTDKDGHILYIGKADARSLFGLKGELESHLKNSEAKGFRYEVNTAYMTRYQELLMVYLADEDRLPPMNKDNLKRLGRLSPGGKKAES